jgi:hypothetical protein
VQRHRRFLLPVQVDLGGQVMPGEDVAVEHDDRLVRAAAQQRRRVPDPAAGAEWLGLVDVVDRQAELRAVAECLGEHLGSVGGRQHDVRDSVLGRHRQLVREERHPGRGQQRLGRGQGEGAQPGAFTPDEQDRL